MRAYAAALPALRVTLSDTPSINDGSDTDGLAQAGTPAVTVTTDVKRFMTLHHSADDTLDKVDPSTLALNVATWASFVHAVAYSDIDFRKRGP